MLNELLSAFDVIEEEDSLKAVIISGAGRGFCAGADLSSGKDTFNPLFDTFGVKEDDFRRDAGGILTLRMYKFLKPIIFACNGPAVGVGASMQLAGDIRIASEHARFGFVFANRGIVPDACSSWFLPKIVGISKALELTFSGRIIESHEALDISLISSLHKPENLMTDAIDIAGGAKVLRGPVTFLRFNNDGSTISNKFKFNDKAIYSTEENPVLMDGDIINVRRTFLGSTTEVLREISTPVLSGYGLYGIFSN